MSKVILIVVSSGLIAEFLAISPGFRKMDLKTVVTVAIFTALSSVGRLLFAAVPSVQPSSYFIILAGALLGPAAGFAVGFLTPLITGLLLGLGYYLPFQMFGWGTMGLLAALLFRRRKGWLFGVTLPVAYGFVWGFLYGFITNLGYFGMGLAPITVQTVIAGQIGSFSFDLAHALSNAALLLVLPVPVIHKILRSGRLSG